MKKLLLILVAIAGLTIGANAQEKNIGLRFGGGDGGYGTEISFQKGMGSNNRAELDLGFGSGDFFWLSGIYQWKFNLVDNFDWYAGAGARVGFCANHGVGVAVLGQVGIEYNFAELPFQVSLDVRPNFEFLLPTECWYRGAHWGGAALSIRYRL